MSTTPLPAMTFAAQPTPAAAAGSSSASPLSATCHCGRVSIAVPSLPQRMNECQCSICYRYGALWAYYARGAVRITGETQPYARADASGKGDLAFHRCAHCGSVTHWAGVHDTPTRQRLGPEAKMGINCRMLPEELIRGVERIRTSV